MLDRVLPDSPRARTAVLSAATIVALLVFTQFVLPGASSSSARGTPVGILFTGLVSGSLSALVAAGLVLVYRSVRIGNFAQTAIGGSGAYLTFLMVRYNDAVPFPVAMVLGLVVAALLGVVFDLVFGRRFFDSPRIVLTVLTIIAGGFVGGYAADLLGRLPFFPPLAERTPFDMTGSDGLRPYLPLRGFTFEVGSLPQKFGFPEVLAIEVAAVALVLVYLFFRFTRTGVAVRALAENSERAKLLGISVGVMTSIVWAMSSVLGGLSVMMSGLIANPAVAQGFAPTLLLPPLAAAVIARMEKLGVAVLAAVGIQVVAASLQWSFTESYTTIFTILMFVIVSLGMLNLQRRGTGGRSEQAQTSWAATEESRGIPAELGRIGSVRAGRLAVVALVVALLGVLPFIASTGQTNLASVIAINGIVGLSLVVLTGWGGQISLAQYGFVGFAALVSGSLTNTVGLSFWIATPLTMAITGAFAALIGLPALRVRGLFLAVSTFAFALVVRIVLFNEDYFDWLIPTEVERPTLFLLDFEDETSMYFLCVAGLLLAAVAVINLRRSRVGRLLIALRENEANVQAFGTSVLRLKLLAFAISGVLTGLAGALFSHQQLGVNGESFAPEASLFAFINTVIGGLGSPLGALLGAAWGGLTTYFLNNNVVFQTVAGMLPLIVIYVAPGGLISLVNKLRDSVLRIVAQRRQIIVPSLFADFDPDALEKQLVPLAEPLTNSGLSALRADQRYTKVSELYRGHGERIVEKLASPTATREATAITAAAEAAIAATFEADDEREEPMGALPVASGRGPHE